MHSGKDASVLFTHEGTETEHLLGQVAAGFGDLDGDGIPDYLASSGRSGLNSFIWSGANGSELRRIERFDSATSLGDPDGDGVPEFLTSWGPAGGGGTVLYYEGLDVRTTLFAPPGAVSYGLGLECLGDVDGDQFPDFAVGAPGETFKTICVPGQVFVYSGKELQLLYRIEGGVEPSMFGQYLASPGDFTGDGIPDLAIAATDYGGGFCIGGGTGRITFHDGLTGAELGEFDLAQLPIPSYGDLGTFLTAVGDLNGNGFGDLIAWFHGPRDNGAGERRFLVAIDGGTRELIYMVPHPYGNSCSGYGNNLKPIGDLNDDGFPDFTASVACVTVSPRSHLDFLSGAPRGVKSFGKPCGNGEGAPPRIGVSGLALVGSDFRLYLSEVAPAQAAILVLGSSISSWRNTPLPFPLRGRGGCLLRVAPELRIPALAGRVRPGEGVAEVAFRIPSDPALVGTTFYAQWLLRPTPQASGPRGASQSGPVPPRRWATTRALAIQVRSSPLDP